MSSLEDYLDAVDQEEKDSLAVRRPPRIDDVMNEDDVSITAQVTEDTDRSPDWEKEAVSNQDRIDFENELKERMLQSELVNEIDLGELVFSNVSLSQRGEKMTETELQDVEAGMKEWSQEYDQCIANPPTDGDILTTLETGGKVLLTVELKEGAPPFIYARAFVPEIVGYTLGWFLADSANQNFHGWKCILLPRARTELIRKFGLQNELMEVASLRVIRPSQSGKSLLCEVHKYGDEAAAKEEIHPVADGLVEGAQDTSEVVTDDALETASKGLEEDAILEATSDELL